MFILLGSIYASFKLYIMPDAHVIGIFLNWCPIQNYSLSLKPIHISSEGSLQTQEIVLHSNFKIYIKRIRGRLIHQLLVNFISIWNLNFDSNDFVYSSRYQLDGERSDSICMFVQWDSNIHVNEMKLRWRKLKTPKSVDWARIH